MTARNGDGSDPAGAAGAAGPGSAASPAGAAGPGGGTIPGAHRAGSRWLRAPAAFAALLGTAYALRFVAAKVGTAAVAILLGWPLAAVATAVVAGALALFG